MPTTRGSARSNASKPSTGGGAQKTLNFRSAATKVTKPSATPSHAGKKTLDVESSALTPTNIKAEPVDDEPAVEEVEVFKKPAKPVSKKTPAKKAVVKVETPETKDLAIPAQDIKPTFKSEPEAEAEEEFEPATYITPPKTPELPLSAPPTVFSDLPADLLAKAKKASTSAHLKTYLASTLKATRTTKAVHQENYSLEERILRLFDMSGEYGPCLGITRLNRWKRAHRLGLSPPVEVLGVLVAVEEEKEGKGVAKRDKRVAGLDEDLSGRLVRE